MMVRNMFTGCGVGSFTPARYVLVVESNETRIPARLRLAMWFVP